jgi:hypothetical protein
LEWLTAIPWPNSTYVPSTTSHPPFSEPSHAQPPTQPLHAKAFLTNARAQLDADHFGLEKIKKRLIEYLAVVRLKEMNAERELAAERQIEQEREAAQRTAKELEGKLDEGNKAIDTQPQAQPQQLQFGVPGASPGNPQHHGRLGKKGVKGPILLYVYRYPPTHSFSCLTNLLLCSHPQLRRTPWHRQDLPRAIRRPRPQPALPAHLPRRRARRGRDQGAPPDVRRQRTRVGGAGSEKGGEG